MRPAESSKSSTNANVGDLKDALPLTDVRGMAKRAQARPTPPTPPFQHNRHNNNNNGSGNNVRLSVKNGAATRLPESRSCDEILSADTDDNDDHVSRFYKKRLFPEHISHIF